MTKTSNLPIACTLSQDERLTRQKLCDSLRPAVQEVQEREHGYGYRLASDDVLPALVEIVRLERRCCPFLQFTLTAAANNGPIWLEVTGPEGTKAFLASFFE